MAFTETSRQKTVFGNKKVVLIEATFGNGDTTGSVDTGLGKVDFCMASYVDAAKIVGAKESATLGTLTLTTEDPTATKTLQIIAIGH